MRGRVTADRLNVRSRPELNGMKIGLLSQNAIVEILGQKGNWLEIKFNGSSGFVHKDFVEGIEDVQSLKGKGKVGLLNVRVQPGMGGGIIGSLSRNTVVNIVSQFRLASDA